ncbi:MAG TPA: branched-chain amino acid ABC transporter substrate-binding protein [Burkholderiales bacterium]|jgi:branched-chain amino acid transport system substrate-binding protein|nr:branched-chain amino acid ABC transporter substrate-binding protein [Burkholderiales bacterium]
MRGNFIRASALGIAAALISFGAWAQTIKVAYIDPLSGPFANVGEQGLAEFRFAVERINASGILGKEKLEVVPFDNKVSPQESLNQLKRVIDQNIRYITQGNSSAVAGALIEAVNRHNERNPGKEILYLNYAAVDPAFTNEKCSFWHFRFDANADMKMESLTTYMAGQKNIKKVYLLNQDYSFGQAVKKAAREMLARKRPDVQIVGDDLHPLGQVKDFAPYIAKIKQSGADSVITGNWGNDMSLLVKAGKEAGLSVDWYTYYAGGLGTPTAMGEAAAGKVKIIAEYHSNVANNKAAKWDADYRKQAPKGNPDFYFLRGKIMWEMFARAIAQAKSAEPKAVALALEGMKYQGDLGEVEMRKSDHQLIQPLYVLTLVKSAAKGGPKEAKIDMEGSGLAPVTDARMEGFTSAVPTSCQMKRP